MSIISRRIEKSAEATMNIGDTQFLKVRSMVSQDIEAADEKELVAIECKMWDDLAMDLRRGMWRLLKGMGKTTDADKKFFEACAQRVQEATAPKQPQEEKKA